MARKKKKEVGVTSTYKTSITFNCPIRGQVTEEAEVKVYEYRGTPEVVGLSMPELELLQQQEEDDQEVD